MAQSEPTNVVPYPTQGDRAPAAPLNPTGGGGTFEGMSIIDAKIAAAEARTDTKFAEVAGEFAKGHAQVIARLDAIEKSTNGLRLNVWLAAATALGLGIAAMAFGASQFGNGVMVTSAAVQDAQEAKRISQENAAEVRALREEIGTFIQAIQQDQSAPQFVPAPHQE